MDPYNRRCFLKRTANAGAVAAAASWLAPDATAAGPPKPRIKVGQIGIGHNHASAKMATFRKLADDFEVVGVVETSPEWRKKRGSDPAYRGLTWMTEEQLLNTKGLTAVAVETDICDLVPTAARCIDAGMHLHLDKPGGESLAPFKRLIEEADRRDLTVQLGYMYRNNPAVQFCQRAVREGWLGQIFEVQAVMSKYQSLAYRQWLGQFRGGSMYIFGCHLIDLVVSMLGKPDRITPFPRQTHSDVRVYDNGLAVFEYPKATATIRAASLEIEGYQRRQLVVCGDEGTIDIRPLETFDIRPAPPIKLKLTLSNPRESFKKGSQEVVFPKLPGRYDDQLIELARIIRGEIENPYPLSHELLVQESLLGAIDYPPLA
jgi:predicted dehydrogenase